MKRYFSVLSLFIRSTAYKIVGLLGGMMILEWILLFVLGDVRKHSLAYLADCGIFSCIFAMVFLGAVLYLSMFTCNFNCKLSYTLGRLSITDKQVFLLLVFSNFLLLWVLWMGQVLNALLYAGYYLHKFPAELVNHQTVMIAFYKSFFMHMIFPLASVTGWLEVGTILVGLSIGCASYSYHQRKGQRETSIFVFGAVVLIRILFTCDPLCSNIFGSSQAELIRATTAMIFIAGVIHSVVSLVQVGRSDTDYA